MSIPEYTIVEKYGRWLVCQNTRHEHHYHVMPENGHTFLMSGTSLEACRAYAMRRHAKEVATAAEEAAGGPLPDASATLAAFQRLVKTAANAKAKLIGGLLPPGRNNGGTFFFQDEKKGREYIKKLRSDYNAQSRRFDTLAMEVIPLVAAMERLEHAQQIEPRTWRDGQASLAFLFADRQAVDTWLRQVLLKEISGTGATDIFMP